MLKMPHPCHNHSQLVFAAIFNGVFVPNRTAGLNESSDACLVTYLYTVVERKKNNPGTGRFEMAASKSSVYFFNKSGVKITVNRDAFAPKYFKKNSMRGFLFLLPISFILCNSKHTAENNVAKWHFYSYAAILTAYSLSDTMDPLECNISIVKSVKGSAVDSIYFRSFYKDTSRVFRFRPFNLDGVAVTKGGIYTPIFHTIKFDDRLNDTANLNYMQKMEKILIGKIKENADRINPWLLEEAKRRGVIN